MYGAISVKCKNPLPQNLGEITMIYECRVLDSVGVLLKIISAKEMRAEAIKRLEKSMEHPFNNPEPLDRIGPDSYNMFPPKKIYINASIEGDE